jgi:hypothetical protein
MRSMNFRNIFFSYIRTISTNMHITYGKEPNKVTVYTDAVIYNIYKLAFVANH